MRAIQRLLFSRKWKLALAVASLPAANQVVMGADATWTGGASPDNTWTSGGNWDTNAPPGSTGTTTNADTATFGTGGGTVIVDANRNLANITFNAAAPAFTLTGGPFLLTSGGVIQTTGTGAASQTINAPISLLGNYTFTSGYTSNSRLLNFGGDISTA